MAFVKISKSSVGAFKDGLPIIRMGSHLQSQKQSSRAIYFSLTRPVIDQVGWEIKSIEGTEERVAVSVAIHEGTGTDAGFLLLEQEEGGYRLGSTRNDRQTYSFAMNVSVTRLKHYVVNDPLIEKSVQEVEFTVDEKDHTILIQCPDWLRYNSLSVPQPEPAPVKVETKDPRPTVVRLVEKAEEEKPEPLKLNREERRRLAKKVVSRLGR
jgi:hypothetical protein